ncbi:MAG TPA: hypothetical protein PK661_10645, partial [Syntrophorhabdaceae bacterium]|nr:hypothetical protein [Syntrophorhabdaceae bacterium]
MRGIVFSIFIFFYFLFCIPFSFAQSMADYCQMPSSIGTPVDPNLLLLVDTSGSMGFCAYSSVTSGSSCDNSTYDSTKNYEGYFEPTKYYKPVKPTN